MNGQSRRRPWLALPAVTAVALVAGACGVETGSSTFSEIPSDEIPFGLAAESTTTSSTSTTTTTTIVLPTPPSFETTTTVPIESVSLFFVSRDELQPVPYALASGFDPNQLAAALEAGPPAGDAGVGLDSHIVEGLIDAGEPRDGVITIDLDEELFDEIAPSDQTLAIGQIVLTFTSNVDRVGLVRFTLGGEPFPVTMANGVLSDDDEPVSYDDYAALLSSGTQADETTTSSTAPSTSAGTG